VEIPKSGAFADNEFSDEALSGGQVAAPSPQQSATAYTATKFPDKDLPRVVDLARKYSVPTRYVANNRDLYEKAEAKNVNEFSDAGLGLKAFSSDPGKASLASGDWNNLQDIEAGLDSHREIQSKSPYGFLGLPLRQGWNDNLNTMLYLGVANGNVDPNEAAQQISQNEQRAELLNSYMPKAAKEYEKAHGEAQARLKAGFEMMTNPLHGSQPESPSIAGLAKMFGTMGLGAGITTAEMLEMVGQMELHAPTVIQKGVRGLQSMALPLVAAGLGTELLPVGGTLAGFFVGNMPQGIADSMKEELSKRGVDSRDPKQLADLFNNAQAMDEIRSSAAIHGALKSGVRTIPMAFLGNAWGKLAAGATFKQKGSAIAEDVIHGTLAMTTGTQVEKVASGQKITPDSAFSDFLDILPTIVPWESLKILHAPSGVPHDSQRFNELVDVAMKTNEAKEAIYNAKNLEIQAANLEKSKVFKESPASVHEILTTANNGTGTPEHFFIDVKDFENYAQTRDTNPNQYAESISPEVRKEYVKAKETNGMVKIPYEDYIVKIIGDPNAESLRAVTRAKPDGMTLMEAAEHIKTVPDQMNGIVERARAENTVQPPTASDLEILKNEVARVRREQYISGRPYSEAQTSSKIYEEAVKQRAERRGLSIPEAIKISRIETKRGFIERTKAGIAKALSPEVAMGKALDRLREDRVPDEHKAYGQNLTNFLVKKGGIARSLERVDVRVFDPVKGLLTRKGMSLDTAAEIAHESGYLKERSVNALLDALNNETRGKNTYSAKNLNPKVEAERNALAELKNELDRRGIDYKNMSNDQVLEAIIKSAESYNQSAFHGTGANFEKFDINKVGSGLGENVMGWGLEFHSVRDVAEMYKTILGEEIVVNGEHKSLGQVFRVEIPEDSHFIDVKKPLSEQSAEIQKALGVSDKNFSGQEAYQALADKLGSREAASKFLAERGVAGLVEHEKTGGKHFVVFDDKLISVIEKYYQSKQKEHLARVVFGKDATYIDLLAKQNASSWQHELGHTYMRWIREDVATLGAMDPASLTEVQKRFLKGTDDVLKWLDAKSWDDLTPNGNEAHDKAVKERQEQWARGWEKYLAEGVAPTKELRTVFEKFKDWMVQVYKNIRRLDVELNPEVRDFMDHLIASDEAIQSTRTEMGPDPLTTNPGDFGLSGKDYEKLITLEADADAKWERDLRSEVMRKFERERAKKMKEVGAEIEAQAMKDIAERPEYQARALLQDGKIPEGKSLPDGVGKFKLSKEAVEAFYDKETVKGLPKGILEEGGLHPDTAAGILGFESGDDLIFQLLNTRDPKKVAKAVSEIRVNERFPDPVTDGTLHDEAVKAMHNDKAAQALREKLKFMLEHDFPTMKKVINKTIRAVPPERAVKNQAAKIVGDTSIREISPYQFYLAERRSRAEAGKLLTAGDLDGAWNAKRIELLNHEAYRAANDAKEYVSKTEKRFRELFRRSDETVAKSMDVDLVNAAKTILSEMGYGPKPEKGLDAYLGALKEYDPDTYHFMRDLAESALSNVTDVRNPTFYEFSSAAKAVQALLDQARRHHEFKMEDQRLKMEDVERQMIPGLDRALPSGKGGVPGVNRDANKLDAFKNDFINSTKARVRIVEHWADAFDKMAKDGFFKKLVHQIIQAGDRFRGRREEVIRDVNEVAKKYQDLFREEKIVAEDLTDVNGVPYTFSSTRTLMGFLLHRGNEGNFVKNLVGRGWATYDPQTGTVDLSRWNAFEKKMYEKGIITDRHYEFAQAIWDIFDGLKPEAQKAHKAVRGTYFEEVSSNPFVTPTGREFSGGYYPAKTDRYAFTRTLTVREIENLDRYDSRIFPSPNDGFTKSRIADFHAPLSFDLGLIRAHIDDVLRFSYMKEPVTDFGRLLRRPEVQSRLNSIDNKAIPEMLLPWLDAASKQQVTHAGWSKYADRAFTFVRNAYAQKAMFINFNSATQNVTDFASVFARIDRKYVRDAMGEFLKNHETLADTISSESKMMDFRLKHQIRDLLVGTNEILIGSSKLQKAQEFYSNHAYVLQKFGQNTMDIITYIAAKNQAIAEGLAKSEADAIRIAESDVRIIHGQSTPESLARFQIGTPAWKFLTMFTNFWTTRFNWIGTQVSTAKDNAAMVGVKQALAPLAQQLALSYWFTSSVSEAIQQAWNGRFDQDDDGAYLDDILSYLFLAPGKQLFSSVPLAGPYLRAAWNTYLTKTPKDDDIVVSPGLSAAQDIIKAPAKIYKAIEGEGSDAEAFRSAASVVETFTALPAAAAARPFVYATKVSEGKTRPKNDADYVRGLLMGR